MVIKMENKIKNEKLKDILSENEKQENIEKENKEKVEVEIDSENKNEEIKEKSEEKKSEKTELEILTEKVKKLELEKKELENKYLRELAEIQNFKKRQNEQVKEIRKFALETIIIELLAPMDSFKLAFKNLDDVDDLEKAKNTIEGLKLIETQFENILKKYGLESFDSLNKEFDPKLHQGVQTEEVDKKKKNNIILEEYQKGYKLNEKVIRAAMVKVGKFRK